jgi:hypothetical protein
MNLIISLLEAANKELRSIYVSSPKFNFDELVP